MSQAKIFSYILLSALLLSAAWPTYGFTPFLFVGFVPLLLIEKEIFNNPERYKTSQLFYYAWWCFVLWNLSVSWWVYFASGGGAAMAILANTLLMTMIFTIAHIVKKKLSQLFKQKFVQWILKYNGIFLLLWLAFEYLHHDWDLTYPWLTLGNGLAANYKIIQWYECTGVLGGSVWILLVNVFVANMISQMADQKKQLIKSTGILMVLIIVPIVISFSLYNGQLVRGGKKIKVVAVQPNIDPYSEKFSGNYLEQLKKMLDLSRTQLDSTTDYLVFPETALTEDIWENNLLQVSSIKEIQTFLKTYPRLTIITGASTAKIYDTTEVVSATAQKFKDGEGYYDNYNTALQLDSSGKVQVYHKSKLVPGVERMPFPALLKPFEKLAISLGGTTGSLGTQSDRTVFTSSSGIKIAPIICYESIYGEFVSGYVKNGAQALFIITNDGWWGDTPGYKQHLIYGRLRAIETRRCIARSANTGISCFINERGDIKQSTTWWQPAVINGEISLNDKLTFFTKHGDYIGRISFYISIAFILLALLGRFVLAKKS
jgi:apolipoprotein N-acyltransferase